MSSVGRIAENLGSEALNNVVTLNQISDNYLGIWNLENTSSDVPADVEFLPYKNGHFNSRINGIDKRQQVADADILPGGKYRSIVKLFLRYANQKASDPWIIGTGWLVTPDLIVTAGHYAFDWSHKNGRLTQVKAYIGYNGKASADDPQSAVQFQQGGQVATPSEWLRSKGMKAYDLAFIKVQQPFTGIVPIDFEDTPRNALSTIGLAGYAGDITDRFSGEKGAHMYEVFFNTEWDLEQSEYIMLESALDPYGGNSGSPVFHQDRLVSIGTHVQGGNPGLASAIGLLGNPYRNYIAAFSTEHKIPGQENLQKDVPVKYIRVSTTKELQHTVDVQNQYRNKTTYNDVDHVEGYRSRDNAFKSETQANGSSSQSQANGLSSQTEANGLFSQTHGNSSLSRTQANDSSSKTQASDSSSQTQANGSSSQTHGNGSFSQTQGNDLSSRTQAKGSFSQTYGNGSFSQTQDIDSSSRTQSNANGSSSQTEFNGLGYQLQTKSSDDRTAYIASNSQAASNSGQATHASSPAESEFFETLKLGIRLSDPVLSDILRVHSPIVLGPIGSPLGALAGAILASAGKLATTLSSPIHDFRQGLPYDGVVERAILGEAAFTVVMSMKRRKLEEVGIFAHMAEVVSNLAPITKKLAPYIMHILTAPALRIALNALRDDPGSSRSGAKVRGSGPESPFAAPYTPSNATLEPETAKFLKRLLAHCVGDDESSKDSLSNMDRIIQIGFREAGPVLTTTAHEGLGYLTTTLPESGIQGPGIPSPKPYIIGLPERAMLGEAALQALIKVPEHQLDERAFAIMAQNIKNNGEIVLRSAHGLIEDVGFSVKALVIVPSISADGIVDNNSSSQTASDGAAQTAGDGPAQTAGDGPAQTAGDGPAQTAAGRRMKGFSFVNLEQEVLDYFRDNNSKPMPSIVEA